MKSKNRVSQLFLIASLWACPALLLGEENIEEWRKKAEQGEASAQNKLGTCYSNGEGVVKNEVEAVKWYSKAALQGNTEAQLNLGICYTLGEGVSKNYILAYKWMLLARVKSTKGISNLNYIEERLTPEQRAEGQRLATEWQAALAKESGSIVGENAAKKDFEERYKEVNNSKSEAETVEFGLDQFVKLANKNLPKMVDGITRLESVAIENGDRIVESYTITTLTKNELKILEEITSEFSKKIKSDFRLNPKTKILRDNNVTWVWNYYDKNGEFIFTVSSSN
jgi:hypothetical protein